MRKYFYTDGHSRFGPFSLNEMKNMKLPGYTLVWYDGIPDWIRVSEISELQRNLRRNPPKKNQLYILIILIVAIVVVSISSIYSEQSQSSEMYDSIRATSYEDEETDFQVYVDKFYRDLEFFGIFPKKPDRTIIKFAKLDQLDNTTHIHAISYGYDDDSVIEIYINPSTWKKFSKPMRYYLMYHELSHDILNLDDLEPYSENEGQLMFPNISSFESLTMDDFIERSHLLFEENVSTY